MTKGAFGAFAFAAATSLAFGCGPRAAQPPSASSAGARSLPPTQPEAGRPLVRATAELATRAGAGEAQTIGFGSARVGDTIDAFVFVPEGRCALVYARGGEGIEDLDLHVYGDDGAQVGADEAPDDRPTLLLCPSVSKRLYVAARIAQGQGIVALALQDLGRSTAEKVARAVGARNFARKPRAIDEAWPGLNAKIARHRKALGGSWVDVRRVALPIDARVPTVVSVQIPKDRCLDAFIAPDEGVAHVEAVALNETGRIFARAQARGNERFVVMCSAGEPALGTLRLRPHAGQGMAAVVLSTSRTPLRETQLHSSVLLHEAHREPPSRSVPGPALVERTLVAKVGTRTSTRLTVRGCVRIDLNPEGDLLEPRVWLWDESGRLLAQSELPGGAPVFVCARGDIRLDAEAAVREGPLRASIHAAQLARDAEETLLQSPLAAARLLQLASADQGQSAAAPLTSVSRVELDPGQLFRLPFSLEAGACESFYLASSVGDDQLEGRLLESPSDLELDFARGRHGLRLRTCAPSDRPLALSLELRSLRYRHEALLGRQSRPSGSN